MITSSATKYARVGSEKRPLEVWHDSAYNTINFTCNDKRLTDEDGQKHGFPVVLSINPRLADYKPVTFNRYARVLHAETRHALAEDPSLMPRRLDSRREVVAQLLAVM